MTQRTNSILASTNNNHIGINIASQSDKRTSINSQLISCSPGNNLVSFFNANFDENGYVFDGVKIDVIFAC